MKSLVTLPTTTLSLLLLFAITPLTTATPRFYIVSGGGGTNSACADAYNSCTDCNVTFRAVWDEAGLRRYRFTFDGSQLIADYGQDFLKRVRCHDGNTVANNWQCWGPNPDGTWTFDISELDGPAGAGYVNRGVADVSGKWPNIPS